MEGKRVDRERKRWKAEVDRGRDRWKDRGCLERGIKR
jgi:hypothetical protein